MPQINQNNYFDQVSPVLATLPVAMKEAHASIAEFTQNGADWSDYALDPEFFDTQFNLLSTVLAKKASDKPRTQSPKKKPVAAKTDQPKSKPPKTNATSAKDKPKTQEPEQVRSVPVGYTLLKSFSGFFGKKVECKRVLNLYRRIEKHLVEDRIPVYRDEVERVHTLLIQYLEPLKKQEFITITPGPNSELVEDIQQILESMEVWDSIPLLKRFIGLKGDRPPKEKVERLLKTLSRKLDKGLIHKEDPYLNKLKAIRKQLEEYLGEKAAPIAVDSVGLK
ncbi:MAG TPA: hypothetical protein DCR93_11375, partial [Cytophagales bacterium]|nr:hypothetical protein [Cytophagales bacterium]